PSPAPPKKDGAKKPQAVAKKPGADATSPRDKTRELLAQLDAIHLAPWDEEQSVRATEVPRRAYRIFHTDGRETMAAERPTAPDGIDRLYVLTDSTDGQHVVFMNG